MSRGFLILYIVASASWLTSLFVSPALGVLLNTLAAWGFWRVTQGFEEWCRQRRHISYSLASATSRGAAATAALTSIGVAALLAEQQISSVETWGVRVLLCVMWTGLWILYYYVLHVRLEDLGVGDPASRHPLTFTALGASILLSPLLMEGLAVSLDVKLALAASLYAGFMPPLNASVLLAALLARR